jgi:hypothetical protein
MTLHWVILPTDTKCRQGDRDPVVGIVALDQGCLVFPDDREQALCLHHIMRITPRGSVDLIAWDPAVNEILKRKYDIGSHDSER